MATFSKTVRATASALYAKEDGTAGKYGPQISGEDAHIFLSSEDGFVYSGAFKFDLGSTFWSGVLDVTKAVLRFNNVARAGHTAPRTNSGYQLRFLNKTFEDNSKAEGEWEIPDKDAVTHSPGYDSRYVKNGAVGSVTAGTTESIDITDWLRRWAPTNKKVKGKKGLGAHNHGIWAVRRITTGQKNPRIVWGSAHADESERPELIVTYKGGDPKGTVLVTSATNPLPSIEGSTYEGTYVPGVEGARLAKLHIQLFRRKGDNSGWETTVRWQNGTSGESVSASEAETGDWTYPVGGSPGNRLTAGLLASGVRYAFQVRAYSNKGVWSDWTALQEIKVQADSPVFATSDLLPGATFSAETLLNVQFGGLFQPSGANLIHGLLSYRVQVRDETAEMDPDWDGGGMHWDTGQVPVSADQSVPPTTTPVTFGSGYKGRLLGPGTYSYRVQVVNRAGEPSLWRYGTFDLSIGGNDDPSDNPTGEDISKTALTGYARRQPKVRIRIRAIEANPQKVIVAATGGTFKLSYDGHVTGNIAYNASDATMQAALEALPGVGTLSVSKVTSGNKRTWTITFVSGGLMEPVLLRINSKSALVYSGTPKPSASVVLASTRKPGRTIAIIDDASNIGASEYYNSAGEFYFTLPHTHPQISVIEPWQVHYSLEMHRGNGWEEMTAGLIHDFDADQDEVVFYGVDYLGVLQMLIDERFNPESNAKKPAILYPSAGWATSGSYYLNKTIKQIVTDQIDQAIHGADSPVAFFSRGSIADMSETIIIYCTFKPRLEFITGLLESWKGKGATSKRTRIRWRKTSGGAYEYRVDDNPGFSRDNLAFEYGGLVNGFRVVPYGKFGTRVNAMGREIGSSKLQYVIAKTPGPTINGEEDTDFNENRYGRWPTVNLWQDITDKADLSRRARQFARSLGKVGKQVGLGIRVDALSLKNGWDITDSVPVRIKRGIVDTDLYAPDANGRSWWTIWGWVLKVSPDGHTDVTLSILPREDTLSASEDITPSAPILSSLSEFVIHPVDPTVDDADGSVKHWVNSVTGHVYELDPETGLWVDLSDTVIGAPQFLVNDAITRERINDSLQPILNVVNHYLIPLNADEDGYDAGVAALYPEGTLVWDQTLLAVYKVEHQGTPPDDRMVWVRSEGVPGAPGSIPAYPEEPDVPIHVDVLPTLPDAGYPEGTQVYLTTAGEFYAVLAGAWAQFAFETTDNLIYDTSVNLLKKFQNGSWVPVTNASDLYGQISDGQLADGSVHSDIIAPAAIDITKLAAQIILNGADTARAIQTSDATQRVVMDPDGLRAYDSSGAPIFNLPTTGAASIVAEVSATSLTVDPAGAGSSLGGVTQLPGGAVATLSAGVADPAVAPTVVDTLDFLTLASAPVGHGICYDGSGYGGVATFLVGGDPSLAGGYVFKEYNASTGALIRTVSPSNSSSTATQTVGSTSHVSDTAQAYSGASNDQIGTPITLPTLSAGQTMKVTAVSAYFAGYGGSCAARTMLWDSSGNRLGYSASFTAASVAFTNGASIKYNKSLTTPVSVSSGQSVRAGFAHSDSTEGFQYDKDDGSSKTTYIGDGGTGDLTGVTTQTTTKPNVYVTVEITSTTTVEGTMGKIVGIARAGTYIFVLDANGKMFRYTQSTGAWSATYGPFTDITGVKANAGLFYDGTDLVILTTAAATGASTLKSVKVSTSGVVGTIVSTGTACTNAATIVLRGGYNDGTNFWLYNSEVGGVTAYTKGTMVVVANRTFATAGEAASGVTWDGSVFRAWITGTTTVWTYTSWDWSTATDPYYFAYAWVDVGTGETAVSPRASITIGRRRRVSVVNPAPPGSPVDSVYVYALPTGAGAPAGTAMKRQATGYASSRFISSYNSGGAAGLSTSSFGPGASAEIKSESAGWSLKGDGSVAFGASTPIGGKPAVVNVYAGVGTTAQTSSTWTKPAGIVGIMVECVGGGGGGGGVTASATAGHRSTGQGGGGGGYSRRFYTAAQLTSSSYTVRAGGGGTAAAGSAGGTGGASDFGVSGNVPSNGACSANGGPAGARGADRTADTVEGMSAGAAAGTGDVTCTGGPSTINLSFGFPIGGSGGASVMGGGGEGPRQSSDAATAGNAGGKYGGGGSGATCRASSSNPAGGVGGVGVVIITEYYGA